MDQGMMQNAMMYEMLSEPHVQTGQNPMNSFAQYASMDAAMDGNMGEAMMWNGMAQGTPNSASNAMIYMSDLFQAENPEATPVEETPVEEKPEVKNEEPVLRQSRPTGPGRVDPQTRQISQMA